MTENIKSATGRKALEPRREPYWERLSKGVYVGYRVQSAGVGTWIARMRDDAGKQKYRALGTCTDFDSAAREANNWVAIVEQGVEVFDATVADACNAYLGWIKLHRASTTAKLVESCFTRFVHGKSIGHLPLAKLQTRHVRTWLNDQVDIDDDDDEVRRSKATANRQLDCLKAALNMALRDRLVSTDAGWATVTRFENVSRRRERFLTIDERSALLKHCDNDMRDLCTGLLLTGARPGELAKCDLQDFDPVAGTLTVDGKTGRRTVALSSAAVAHFKKVSKDRIGKQPLLIRELPPMPDGGETVEGFKPPDPRWNKENWKKRFNRAVKDAGLPADVVPYSLRHAAISEFVASGMDSYVVATITGTSVEMIQKHYGHLRTDRTRQMLDKAMII
jgi:integrase